MDFKTLMQTYRRQKNLPLFEGTLLALDPGETTGWARFKVNDGIPKLDECGQLASTPIDAGVRKMIVFISQEKPDFLVFEQYRVYSWKSASHSWESLHTPKLIGSIQTVCTINDIPNTNQMAQEAKMFCTDEKLREWGYYAKGLKHARDAIRHGCYFLMFNEARIIEYMKAK